MTKKLKTTAVVDMPSDTGTIQVPPKKLILAKIQQLKTDLADLEKLVKALK